MKHDGLRVKCLPCKSVFKMVFWHHWVTNQGVDIFWNRIRVCWRDVFVYIFYIHSIFRKPTSTSNHGNIHIKPLATTGLIRWNKYAWLLTSSDYSNNSYRRFSRLFNLQKVTCINLCLTEVMKIQLKGYWILWSKGGTVLMATWYWFNYHRPPKTSLHSIPFITLEATHDPKQIEWKQQIEYNLLDKLLPQR